MIFVRTALLVLVMCAYTAVSGAQIPPDGPQLPTFTELVIVRPMVRADFDARVLQYVDLRTMLEEGLPAPRLTDHPGDNISIQRTLARRIRLARAGALRGAIFTTAISAEFRRILQVGTTPATLAAVMDDNPGLFSHRINSTYPEGKPLSAMPGTFLAVLPTLPEGLEYRFVGEHLILLDARANVILDRIPCAIGCVEIVR